MRTDLLFFVFSVFWTCIDSRTCTTPSGVKSECIRLIDCESLAVAFQQRPLTNQIVSFLKASQCGFEGLDPLVCCGPLPTLQKHEPITTTPPPPLPPTIYSGSTTGPVDPPSTEDSSPAPRTICGADTNGDRIYGGTFTDLDEFPWMSLLGYRTSNGSLSYACGGSLINRRYVLTAAHCVAGAIEQEVGISVTVRLGEYDLQNPIDCLENECADAPQEIPVAQAIPYPDFSDKYISLPNDISLVRLAQRAIYSFYVKPICLPDNSAKLDTGVDVYVAGWGQTPKEQASPIKLKLRLPIFSKNDCKKKYRHLNAFLTDKQICAGGVVGKDACRGDSGGPLMRKMPDGVWESVAIVSFGGECGTSGLPGVYTRVHSYMDWIQSTLRSTNV